MNTKNLDAIKHMVVRLQATLETDKLDVISKWNISNSLMSLRDLIDHYEIPNKENAPKVRTD